MLRRPAPSARAPLALLSLSLVALTAVGCGERDPEENCRLWSNNQAGWQEMGKFVADTANPVDARARCLVILAESGQPSQVRSVLAKAPDKPGLGSAVREAMAKLLKDPNDKLQGYAKAVLFDIANDMDEAEKKKTLQLVADWAFSDLSPDDAAQRVVDKLSRRIRPDELEALGDAGIKGGEIMLSKGIEKDGVLTYLQMRGDNPEAHAAIVHGLRRYHGMSKKIKITEAQLGFLQRTNHPDALVYLAELYERLSKSDHPDDERLASLCAALVSDGVFEQKSFKPDVKKAWPKLEPVMERYLERENADDRWMAASLLVKHEGVKGLQTALAKLPDDGNYGNSDFAVNDVKMVMTDFCEKDVKPLGEDKVLPILAKSLKSERLIEAIVAIRCALAFESAKADELLATVDDKANRIVDPIVVPQSASEVTVYDLAVAARDIITFVKATDEALAKKEIDAETAKWRKFYARFSFERKNAHKRREKDVLTEYATSRAAAKVERDKKKAAK